MSKNRFSTPDVQAEIRDLRCMILGQRISNIYDINDKTYLFKFAVPGSTEKAVLLMESGIRFHCTKYSRPKSDMPSPFAMKLRKFLRTKRLDNIQQLGNDRVVDFKFGSGIHTNHIILELYASGNIVLTDNNYQILALLRSHQFEEEIAIKVGEIYPLNYATLQSTTTTITTTTISNTLPTTTTAPISNSAVCEIDPAEDSLPSSSSSTNIVNPPPSSTGHSQSNSSNNDSSSDNNSSSILHKSYIEFLQWTQEKLIQQQQGVGGGILMTSSDTFPNSLDGPTATTTTTTPLINTNTTTTITTATKKSKQRKMTLKQLFLHKDSGVSLLGGELLEHSILMANISLSMKVDNLERELSITQYETLQYHFQQSYTLLSLLNTPGKPGYIIYNLIHKSATTTDTTTTYNNNDNNAANNAIVNTTTTTTTTTTNNTTDSTNITTTNNNTNNNNDVIKKEYIEFIPMKLKQHDNKLSIEFSCFDDAVDEYFYQIEDQKLYKQALAQEESATKKIEKVRKEQESLLQNLSYQQQKLELSAMLIEAYADDIDKVCLVLNSAIQSGLTWLDIDDMVKRETATGNPIASLISKLKLERNHVILKLKNLFLEEDSDDITTTHNLGEEEDYNRVRDTADGKKIKKKDKLASLLDSESESDNELNETKQTKSVIEIQNEVEIIAKKEEKISKKSKNNSKKKDTTTTTTINNSTNTINNQYYEVEIDITQSAYANARKMFSHKKVAQVKENKTREASIKAIQIVEQQVEKTLSKQQQQIVHHLKSIRKVYWFEKFNWFITTEGYLVLCGRDAQQNETLVKKYMRNEDIYVHANIAGASTVIVRNKSTSQAVSPLALHEAATMAVCRSQAWNNKAVTSAWWVYPHQVSQTAPSGEYLTTGSFMIYGKKNFLPPSPLEMGFGILFRLDDSCVAKHIHERKMRGGGGGEEGYTEYNESVYSEAADRYGLESYPHLHHTNTTTTIADTTSDNTTSTSSNGSASDAVSQQHTTLISNSKLRGKKETVEKQKSSTTATTSTSTTQPVTIMQPIDEEEEEDEEEGLEDASEEGLEDASEEGLEDASEEGLEMKEQDNDDNNHIEKKLTHPNFISTQSDITINKEIQSNNDIDTEIYLVDTTIPSTIKAKLKQKHQQQQQQTKQQQQQSIKNQYQMSDSMSNGKDKKSKKDNKKDKQIQKKGDKQKQSIDDDTHTSTSKNTNSTPKLETIHNIAKKKHINKKKLRRYAEQDEDDRILALQALGQNIPGYMSKEALNEVEKNEKEALELMKKQQRVGIIPSTTNTTTSKNRLNTKKNGDNYNDDDDSVLDAVAVNDNDEESQAIIQLNTLLDSLHLSTTIRTQFITMIDSHIITPTDIDTYEIQSLTHFSDIQAIEILTLFEEGCKEKKIINKSGFLAGIMKRFQQQQQLLQQQQSNGKKTMDSISSTNITKEMQSVHINTNSNDDTVNVGKDDKEVEICDTDILQKQTENYDDDDDDDDMGNLEGDNEDDIDQLADTSLIDELDKLTGTPNPDDIVLYAVPVCGPYSTLQRYKYRVKLTPGTGKKGKICKQAIQFFIESKEYTCTSNEKNTIKNLNDPEMVAIMIGDVKLSMPGLQQLKQQQKKVQRGQKKKDK